MKKREEQIQKFIQDCLGEYSVLKYKIELNDNSDQDCTDFLVTVTNTTNNKQICSVLRCYDYEGGIELLKGEDFYATDEKDFVVSLFLTEFLTLIEV